MDPRTLSELLDRVASGETSAQDAALQLQHLPYEELPDARIDHQRHLRTGQAEAVYGPGKTTEQVTQAVASLLAHTDAAVFVTRATPEQFAAAREAAPEATYEPRSGLVVAQRATLEAPLGTVGVVSAGTSDLPIAEEASWTAEAMGLKVERLADVGVAGIQRVLDARDQLVENDCLIVIAGMEGALPSVVSGLTPRPVIAVPTSVGYGTAFEGITALLAMLSSCAPGVAVVNIDNGFGAAHVAHRILMTAAGREEKAP